MKRLPLFVTVLAVVLLSASLAYWGLQLFKPQQRAIAAVRRPDRRRRGQQLPAQGRGRRARR
jgi:hypothetical protein